MLKDPVHQQERSPRQRGPSSSEMPSSEPTCSPSEIRLASCWLPAPLLNQPPASYLLSTDVTWEGPKRVPCPEKSEECPVFLSFSPPRPTPPDPVFRTPLGKALMC